MHFLIHLLRKFAKFLINTNYLGVTPLTLACLARVLTQIQIATLYSVVAIIGVPRKPGHAYKAARWLPAPAHLLRLVVPPAVFVRPCTLGVGGMPAGISEVRVHGLTR